MKILVISGWGLDTQVLTTFAEQLAQQHQVEVWDIFDPHDPVLLAEKVRHAQEMDVLLGWSLGGQLAVLLAHKIYQQVNIAKPVIACMSNPCFVAQENWPNAMPKNQYEQFKYAVIQHPEQALQRFCALVTLGSSAPRERAKYLQQQLVSNDLSYQQAHLDLLEQLNVVSILKNYPGKMLFILAEKDRLVPDQVAVNMMNIAAKSLKVVKIQAAHDAVIFDSQLVIKPISDFLKHIS